MACGDGLFTIDDGHVDFCVLLVGLMRKNERKRFSIFFSFPDIFSEGEKRRKIKLKMMASICLLSGCEYKCVCVNEGVRARFPSGMSAIFQMQKRPFTGYEIHRNRAAIIGLKSCVMLCKLLIKGICLTLIMLM